MLNTTQALIDQYISGLKRIFSAHLKRIILYGSYARGDYNSEDVGTTEDVALHRLNVAIEDLDDAQFLFDAEKYRGANNLQQLRLKQQKN